MDLFADEVFVFTPRGDVVNLPAGATPIDFAYNIHSAVGNAMTGCKVNGRIVTFDYQLQSGDIVEVITSKSAHGPSRDWMKICKSNEARNKIRQWFKKERREENIAEGKNMLDKELRRNLITLPEDKYDSFMEDIAHRQRMNSAEEMFAALGYGGLQMSRLLPKVKIDIVVCKVPVETLLATVQKTLYTGNIGDGKVFLFDVEDVLKIRTGERGYDALQDEPDASA